jgi:outer membrane protein TolC
MKRVIGPRCIALIILLAGSPLALPAQSTEEGVELTLKEAVDRALKSSNLLEAGRATMDARSAARAQARTGRYPSLDFEASYMRMKEQDPGTIELPPPPQGPGPVTLGEPTENSYVGTISLRQPLFTGGEVASLVEAADQAVAASRGAYEWDRGGLELDVRRAYWKLMEAQLRVKAIEERVRQVAANLENMERRQANGVVTRSEVLTVEMKLAEVRLALLRARNGRELASTRLALLTGLSPDRRLLPVTRLPETVSAALPSASADTADPRPGDPSGPSSSGAPSGAASSGDPSGPEAPSLASLIEEALANRGDLAEYRANLEAARARERSSRAGWFPKVFVAGEYTYARPNQAIFPAEDKFESSWRIGLVGRIELGAMPRVYHESARRNAELSAVAASLEAAEDRVRLAVREAYLNWRSYTEELELAGTMVRQAEENLTGTTIRVENGVALNEDLLKAQATLLEARLALTSARIGRRIAWDRLMRETGREL